MSSAAIASGLRVKVRASRGIATKVMPSARFDVALPAQIRRYSAPRFNGHSLRDGSCITVMVVALDAAGVGQQVAKSDLGRRAPFCQHGTGHVMLAGQRVQPVLYVVKVGNQRRHIPTLRSPCSRSPGHSVGPVRSNRAQTTLPRPGMPQEPHRSLSAWTISSPRPPAASSSRRRCAGSAGHASHTSRVSRRPSNARIRLLPPGRSGRRSRLPLIRELDPSAGPLDFFGAELRRWRTSAGLSQEQLGQRVGYSGAQVGKLETGERAPSQDFAQHCGQALPDAGGLFVRIHALARRWDGGYPSWFAEWVGAERRDVAVLVGTAARSRPRPDRRLRAGLVRGMALGRQRCRAGSARRRADGAAGDPRAAQASGAMGHPGRRGAPSLYRQREGHAGPACAPGGHVRSA